VAASPLPPDPSTRFLHLCLAARWQPEALQQAHNLAQTPNFDWQQVEYLAHEEEVAPLLYAALRHQPWTPPPLLARLHRTFVDTGSRNALLLAELEAVLAALAGAGIPALLLKGAALAEPVYGSIALRPMVDLDLLLPRGQFAAAVQLLAGLGFAPAHTEAWAGLNLTYENELLLTKASIFDVALDLHWSLVDSPYYQERLDMGWFWQTAQPVQIGAVAAQILGPEAQMLHLCSHLALHHGRQTQPVLLWQHDVAALLHAADGRLDWPALLAKAEALELVLPLQQVIEQLLAIWPLPVPAAAVTQLRRLRPSPAEVRAFRRLTSHHRPVLRRFWDDLSAIPGWRRRFHYALLQLFPSPTYMRQRYALPHPWLLPVAYPYRWALGLWHWLRSQ
jgi:hypothetical protein